MKWLIVFTDGNTEEFFGDFLDLHNKYSADEIRVVVRLSDAN